MKGENSIKMNSLGSTFKTKNNFDKLKTKPVPDNNLYVDTNFREIIERNDEVKKNKCN